MPVSLLHASDSLVAADTPSAEGFRRAVGAAVDRDVDAVVHTGNLLRRPSPDEADLDAVATALDPLAEADIPCYAVAGPREAAGETDTLARLADRAPVERLGARPTHLDDIVALYGIDRGPDLGEALASLVDEDRRTHNLLCLHHEITPPLNPYSADLKPFEITDESSVFLNGVLAGGSDDPREWTADDYAYRVAYAGTTNPEVADSPGDRPTAALLTVHGADAADREVVQLRPDGESRAAGRPAASDGAAAATDDDPEAVTPTEEMAPLLDLLDYEEAPLADADTETLVDLYGLLSRVSSLLDDRRKEVGDVLETRLAADEESSGRYATIRRTRSTRRTPRDEETVFAALSDAGIDRERVLGIDSAALRDLADQGEVDEEAVFEHEERTYVRRRNLSVGE